jgi:hypothetical protein
VDNKLRKLQWQWQDKGREKDNVLCVKDRKWNVGEKDSKNWKDKGLKELKNEKDRENAGK